MDFADLDLRAASERGSWVHLKLRGEPMFLDNKEKEPSKPCRILIKGMGSEAVLSAFRKVDRLETLIKHRLDRASDSNADALLARYQDDQEAAMSDLVVASVSDWENILWQKKPLDCTRDNILMLCGPGTLFFGQVTDAIREEQRLFTSADSA
jgi:hypothetical protein